MKILELNFERTWRGGERQTLYNLQGFQDAGCEVALVCRKGFPLEKETQKADIRTFAFDDIFSVVSFLITNGSKYDVLHAQTSHILTYCLATKPFHQAQVLFSRRVDFIPSGFSTRLKYRLTDKLVAISNPVKEIISSFSGRNDVSVISDIVVPVAINEDRARKEIETFGWRPGLKIVATIAALVPHKDPLTMVEAVKKLSDIRQDFIFLHFGSGELYNTVKDKIAENSLEKHYKLLGFVENVEDFFSVFDVFAMSSVEEGLGSTVLDAFAYKIPVVATNAGGLGDLVSDGRGITTPKKDAKSLADGINELLSRPENYRPMIEKAHDYVLKQHNLQYITSEYLLLINK
jgi:glycosyltransferase involved in cell wall biosynthesis